MAAPMSNSEQDAIDLFLTLGGTPGVAPPPPPPTGPPAPSAVTIIDPHSSSTEARAQAPFSTSTPPPQPSTATGSSTVQPTGAILIEDLENLFESFSLNVDVSKVAGVDFRQETLSFEEFVVFLRNLTRKKGGGGGGGGGGQGLASNRHGSLAHVKSSTSLHKLVTEHSLAHVLAAAGPGGEGSSAGGAPGTTASGGGDGKGGLPDDILSARSDSDDGTGMLSARGHLGSSASFSLGDPNRGHHHHQPSNAGLLRHKESVLFGGNDDDSEVEDLPPYLALQEEVAQYQMDLPNTIDHAPALQKALLYGGIGATKTDRSVKLDSVTNHQTFPPLRRQKYSLDAVKARIEDIEAQASRKYQPAVRKPNCNVAFAGARSLSRSDVGSVKLTRTELPTMSKSAGNSPVPGSRLSSPSPMAQEAIDRHIALKQSKPKWKMQKRMHNLPEIKDVYRGKAKRRTVDELAHSPSFALPVLDRQYLQQQVRTQAASMKGQPVGRSYHTPKLKSMAVKALSLLGGPTGLVPQASQKPSPSLVSSGEAAAASMGAQGVSSLVGSGAPAAWGQSLPPHVADAQPHALA